MNKNDGEKNIILTNRVSMFIFNLKTCDNILYILLYLKLHFFYRIADSSDDVGRQRPPRLFHSDKIIRPYNRVEAFGNAILQVNKENCKHDLFHFILTFFCMLQVKLSKKVQSLKYITLLDRVK